MRYILVVLVLVFSVLGFYSPSYAGCRKYAPYGTSPVPDSSFFPSFDLNSSGIVISVERSPFERAEFFKVLLFVPTDEDKRVWVTRVNECYRKYEEAFWEAREMLQIEKDKEEVIAKERRRSLDRLRNKPIRVFPE